MLLPASGNVGVLIFCCSIDLFVALLCCFWLLLVVVVVAVVFATTLLLSIALTMLSSV